MESTASKTFPSVSLRDWPLKIHVKLLPLGTGLDIKVSCTTVFSIPSLTEYLSCPLYSGGSKGVKRGFASVYLRKYNRLTVYFHSEHEGCSACIVGGGYVVHARISSCHRGKHYIARSKTYNVSSNHQWRISKVAGQPNKGGRLRKCLQLQFYSQSFTFYPFMKGGSTVYWCNYKQKHNFQTDLKQKLTKWRKNLH